jgi:hypothetical protein
MSPCIPCRFAEVHLVVDHPRQHAASGRVDDVLALARRQAGADLRDAPSSMRRSLSNSRPSLTRRALTMSVGRDEGMRGSFGSVPRVNGASTGRDGIVAAWMERMTPRDAACREPTAAHRAEALDGVDRVFGAGGDEPAIVGRARD